MVRGGPGMTLLLFCWTATRVRARPRRPRSSQQQLNFWLGKMPLGPGSNETEELLSGQTDIEIRMFGGSYSSSRAQTAKTQASRIRKQESNLKPPEPDFDFKYLALHDPAVAFLSRRVSENELGVASQRGQCSQLLRQVQTLAAIRKQKEHKNSQLRQKCQSYPQEVLMDLEEQREYRQTKQTIAQQRQNLAAQIAAEEAVLLRRRLQLQGWQTHLLAARQSKKKRHDKLVEQNLKAKSDFARAQQVLARIAEESRERRSDKRFAIAEAQRQLQGLKASLESVCMQQDILLNRRKESQIDLPTGHPHSNYLKHLEKELAKFYFEFIAEALEEEQDSREEVQRLGKLQTRLRKLGEELLGEQRRMEELILAMNSLSEDLRTTKSMSCM